MRGWGNAWLDMANILIHSTQKIPMKSSPWCQVICFAVGFSYPQAFTLEGWGGQTTCGWASHSSARGFARIWGFDPFLGVGVHKCGRSTINTLAVGWVDHPKSNIDVAKSPIMFMFPCSMFKRDKAFGDIKILRHNMKAVP